LTQEFDALPFHHAVDNKFGMAAAQAHGNIRRELLIQEEEKIEAKRSWVHFTWN
jgi:hypothetical protein